jgi:hypothetical protein
LRGLNNHHLKVSIFQAQRGGEHSENDGEHPSGARVALFQGVPQPRLAWLKLLACITLPFQHEWGVVPLPPTTVGFLL